MSEDLRNILLKGDEREKPTALGNRVTIKLTGEETGGAYSMVTYTAHPGFAGPPPHRHDFDELFYVLEGQLDFQLGTETVRAGRGELVFAPRGAVHTFANPGAEPVSFLIVFSPPGFEGFFAELADRLRETDGTPDMGVMTELNQKYGVETVQPLDRQR
jgi:quercetin dioxygenase-like cupin family protein